MCEGDIGEWWEWGKEVSGTTTRVGHSLVAPLNVHQNKLLLVSWKGEGRGMHEPCQECLAWYEVLKLVEKW